MVVFRDESYHGYELNILKVREVLGLFLAIRICG